MSDLVLGDHLTVLRPAALAARRVSATFLVVGAAQGMTSFLAYALIRAGVHLGDRFREVNHEDAEFAALFFNPRRGRTPAETAALHDLIARRNAMHPRWGFKFPRAIALVPDLAPLLRDPVVVVALRNPLAVMQSIRSRNLDTGRDGLWLLRKGLAAHLALSDVADRTDAPFVLCDMDAARAAPLPFLTDLFAMLGIEADAATIAAEIAEPGYRPLPDAAGQDGDEPA
ncbi:MAG: hypothetical protein KF887_18475 [Paracoccaceae bacterium]|nr:MAG: hypothetical protein KF887_18475 [Paracoccaceae bacterium]